MKTLSLALLAAFALVVAPSAALAGGGPAPGTKNTATLTLRNGTQQVLVAVVNPSQQLQALAAVGGTTYAALQAQANADGSTLVPLGPGGVQQISPRPNTPLVVGVVALTALNGTTVANTANLSPTFTIPGGQSRTMTFVQSAVAGNTQIQFQTTNP